MCKVALTKQSKVLLMASISACLISVCISSSIPVSKVWAIPANSLSQSSDQSSEFKNKVTEIAPQIIGAINDVALTGDFKSSAEKRKIGDINITPILKRIERQRRSHEFLKGKGKNYKNFRSQFTIQDITISGDTASVSVQEYTEIELGDPGEVKEGIVPKYISQHRLTFTAVGNGKVKFKSAQLLNDPEDSDSFPKGGEPAPPGVAPAVIDSLQSKTDLLPDMLTSSLFKFEASSSLLISNKILESTSPTYKNDKLSFTSFQSQNRIAQSAQANYNRPGAVAYAGKWWNGFNPKYQNFENFFGIPFWNLGDCTNFVSQALYEGGRWVMKGAYDNKASDIVWWYDPNVNATVANITYIGAQSYTWAGALNLWNFLNKTGRATPVNRSSLLDIGDIVQVDFGQGSGLSHTMLVTHKRSSDGMIYLAGHTKAHYQMPIYDLQSKYPNLKVYAWRLASLYTP
jgi:hypothetical protein